MTLTFPYLLSEGGGENSKTKNHLLDNIPIFRVSLRLPPLTRLMLSPPPTPNSKPPSRPGQNVNVCSGPAESEPLPVRGTDSPLNGDGVAALNRLLVFAASTETPSGLPTPRPHLRLPRDGEAKVRKASKHLF